MAGFDNRVSIAVALLASLTLFCASCIVVQRRSRGGLVELGSRQPGIPARLIWLSVMVNGLVLGCVAAACLLAPRYLHSDIRYLLDPAMKIADFGLRPYRDFDFAYGPLILYSPVVLHALLGWSGIGMEACYYIATIAVMLGGIWLTAWVITQLVPDRKIKAAIFLGVTLTTINLTLGSNGTALRSIAPFALILLFGVVTKRVVDKHAQHLELALVVYASGSSFLAFLISPEIGIAFSCSAICWGFLSGYFGPRGLFLVMLSPLAGILGSSLVYGSNIFGTIRMYSGGGMNWVMIPYSLMLLYLLSIVVLVPMGMGEVWRDKHLDRPTLLSLYCCALCLLPAALSRCDFGHLLINGMGVFILATGHICRYSRRLRLCWVISLITVFAAFEGMWVFTNKRSLTLTFYDAAETVLGGRRFGALEQFSLKVPVWRSFTRISLSSPLNPVREIPGEIGTDQVSVPWQVDKITEGVFRRANALGPEYYTDFILVATPDNEVKKIQAVSRYNWVLTPIVPTIGIWNKSFVRRYFLYPANYKEIHEAYPAGLATAQYIRSHFTVARRLGDYLLYRRE